MSVLFAVVCLFTQATGPHYKNDKKSFLGFFFIFHVLQISVVLQQHCDAKSFKHLPRQQHQWIQARFKKSSQKS